MPKRKKGNATQPPPTKRRSTRSTAATSHFNRDTTVTSRSTCNTIATSRPTRGISATTKSHSMSTTQTTTVSINTSKTPDNTSVGATQQQSPQTQQLLSQLSKVLQLLTTSLSGNALTNNSHPQVSMTDNNSAEILSNISKPLGVAPNPSLCLPKVRQSSGSLFKFLACLLSQELSIYWLRMSLI